MNNIKNLNEAFERMFKEALDDETLSHVFDKEYALMMSEIEEDNAAMQKMYDTGNVSPAAALNSLGYVDADEETLTSESIVDGVKYTKVFHFNDDFTHEYYVLQDGKIPSGWTVTKSAVDDEVLDRLIGKSSEKLEEIRSRMNEAEISDEDKKADRLAKSQAKYNKAVADAEDQYKWNTEDASRSRDYYQKRIDKLLKRDKSESIVESATGKWSTIAYNMVDDMGTDSLRDFAYAVIKWLSDNDVGEFLHQNDYVPYSEEK